MAQVIKIEQDDAIRMSFVFTKSLFAIRFENPELTAGGALFSIRLIVKLP